MNMNNPNTFFFSFINETMKLAETLIGWFKYIYLHEYAYVYMYIRLDTYKVWMH